MLSLDQLILYEQLIPTLSSAQILEHFCLDLLEGLQDAHVQRMSFWGNHSLDLEPALTKTRSGDACADIRFKATATQPCSGAVTAVEIVV
jgi:hypothetical protein